MIMKKVLTYSFTLICAVVIGLGILCNQSVTKKTDLILQKSEACADCELTNNKGKVIFKCEGSGTCSADKLGYTLTCNSTEVAIKEIEDD